MRRESFPTIPHSILHGLRAWGFQTSKFHETLNMTMRQTKIRKNTVWKLDTLYYAASIIILIGGNSLTTDCSGSKWGRRAFQREFDEKVGDGAFFWCEDEIALGREKVFSLFRIRYCNLDISRIMQCDFEGIFSQFAISIGLCLIFETVIVLLTFLELLKPSPI